ncbi:MAG: phospholipid carrier-dependent glycosyltransferase, partial [Candidatus Eisenbacteria bacterium]|nr:phospholipid carrier-dependent glycosyltransferase [Candidatus Latescibacterota bacterium]MBD3302394.1 phospholipid carrier-dependent glycosyltransferase [Candidatus Eisenbacteria bacterium]
MRRDPILWLLLAIGGFLRFWGIDGDLPYVLHYDEPTLIDNAVWMLQHETLHPHFFNYPTGLIYLLAGLFGALLLGGRLIGRFEGGQEAIDWLTAGTYTRPPEGGVLYFYPTVGVPTLYLIGRIVSATAGVLTIALVYALARRCGTSRGTARLASLLFALAPLAVAHAHLITTDSAAMAAGTLALLAVLRAEEGGARRWLLAGALGGMAAGIKYNAGLVVLVLPVLAVWLWRSRPTAMIRPLLLAALAAILAFLLLTPFAVLDPEAFLGDLGHELRRVSSVMERFQDAAAVEASPVEKLGEIFWHHLGPVGILVGLWGAIRAIRSRRFAMVAIVVWVAVSLLPQLRWQTLYARYLLPSWPGVILLVALGLSDLAARLRTGLAHRPRVGRLAVVALVALVLVGPLHRLVLRESRRLRPDPRIRMTEWIESNVPHGETLVMEPGGPFPGREHYTIQRIDFLGQFTPEEYRARGVRYLITSGRARLVEGEEEFRSVRENLEEIRRNSRVVWESGRHAVRVLEGWPEWEDSVRAAVSRGDLVLARRILEERAGKGDPPPRVWKRLGEIRSALGDVPSALDAYRRAARIDTADAELAFALSNLHLERGDWDAALDELDRARRLAPLDPLVPHNLAVAHLYRARHRFEAGDRAG